MCVGEGGALLGYLLSGRAVFEEARSRERERVEKKKRGGEKSRESRHREESSREVVCVSRRGRVRVFVCGMVEREVR